MFFLIPYIFYTIYTAYTTYTAYTKYIQSLTPTPNTVDTMEVDTMKVDTTIYDIATYERILTGIISRNKITPMTKIIIERKIAELPYEITRLIAQYLNHIATESLFMSYELYTPKLTYGHLDSSCTCMSYIEVKKSPRMCCWLNTIKVNPNDELDYKIYCDNCTLDISFNGEIDNEIKLDYESKEHKMYSDIHKQIKYGNIDCLASKHTCICNDNKPHSLNTIEKYLGGYAGINKMQCRATIHGPQNTISRCICPPILYDFETPTCRPTAGICLDTPESYICDIHNGRLWQRQKNIHNVTVYK